MLVDSSALISILLKEPGHEVLEEKMAAADTVFVGAPIALETAIVLSARLGHDARPMLATTLRTVNAEIVEFGSDQYDIAVSALLRFGKGRHRAALKFGDCMSYALAAISDQPLLYSGTDFSRTGTSGA
jgi:ribonuclease VapC